MVTASANYPPAMATVGTSPQRGGIGGVSLALLAAGLYTAGMAVIWLFADYAYADAHLLVRASLPFLMVLVAVIGGLAWVSRVRIQRTLRLGGVSLLGVVPVVLAGVGLAIAVDRSSTVDAWGVVAVVVGTLLVGIGEETTYRGLVLNGLGERVSVTWAIVLSSILFGLLHVVNVIVSTGTATAVQVALTTCIGLLFGFVYVASGGNLVLVITLHWLYDACLIAPGFTAYGDNALGLVATAVAVIFGIAALIAAMIRYRGRSLTDVLAR